MKHILDFAGHIASNTTTQLHYYITNVATDNVYTDMVVFRQNFIPIPKFEFCTIFTQHKKLFWYFKHF